MQVYQQKDVDAISARLSEDNIRRVSLWSTDIGGALKEKSVPIQEFYRILGGSGSSFDGSSVEGFARINESDMFLCPDLSTYAPYPTGGSLKKARFMCDVYTPSGEPFGGSPRYILKKMIAEMKKTLGNENAAFYVAPELEFYLLKDGRIPCDSGGYFDVVQDDFCDQCVILLNQMGIEDEAYHHEVGKGQFEIDIVYGDALRISDNAITFKWVVKTVAKKAGLEATFMPKPFSGEIAGSGAHYHVNIVTEKDTADGGRKKDKNLFYDKRKKGFSNIALYSIGGLLEHAKAGSAIWCPTVNSYKRLGKSEAPKYFVWGPDNRSALIRVPSLRPDDGGKSLRFEIRCPDPSSNPYLATAVMLACMLDGIKNKIKPGESVNRNMFRENSNNIETLPDSLEQALNYLEQDEVIKNALGKHCFNEFVNLKRKELDDFNSNVTSWEIDHYRNV